MQGETINSRMRTDLAIEAREMLLKEPQEEIQGVELDSKEEEGVKISRVRIKTPEAAERMGKKMGNYVTLEAPGLKEKDSVLQEKVSQLLAWELAEVMQLDKEAKRTVLV
ncbi:MAG TPA: GPR endopeptidase, partial [Firmicutes bacterium]|nr:GPR endopeptidase [Bacillota bacterium]